MGAAVNQTANRTPRTHVLGVRNVTGLAEERGFRLYWYDPEQPNILCPALGLVTSNPFRREREAIAYGERQGWGRATRI